MKKYQQYKSTNIDWIDSVPSHWNIIPLKYNTKFINGSPFKPNEWSETGVPIIRIENLNGSEDFNYFNNNVDKKYHIKKGDLLFAWSGNKGTSFGPFLWNKEGLYYLNQHIFKLDEYQYNKKYFYWLLKAVTFYVEYRTHGIIGLVHITKQDLGSIKIPDITNDEQKGIANFLDIKTNRIDSLIIKKQKLIDLLKEERTAIINHSVTKGIDSTVDMKASGIEWLGNIPQHWNIRRIKRLTQVKRGASPRPIEDPKYFDDNGEFSWVRISDVSASEKYLEKTEQRLSELGASLSVKQKPGDLFISIAGTVGKPIITTIKCCIHDGFVWFPNLSLNKEFLYYIFLTGEAYKGLGKMGTQLNLNTDTVGQIFIPLPPKEEIEDIISYIKQNEEDIKRTISKIQKEIDLLQEYRTALISEVVTGKIDVRQEVI